MEYQKTVTTNAASMLRKRKYKNIKVKQMIRFSTLSEYFEGNVLTNESDAKDCSDTTVHAIVLDLVKKKKPDESLGKKHSDIIINIKTECGYKNMIVISKQTITSSAKKSLKNNGIEIFSWSDFNYDVTAHIYQPVITLLNMRDSNGIKKSFGESKLPHIKLTDIIVRYYNAKLGNVMMFEREDGVYYRMVVP